MEKTETTSVMSARVLNEALRLPDQERAELVARVLDSLEDSDVVEPRHEAAWTEVFCSWLHWRERKIRLEEQLRASDSRLELIRNLFPELLSDAKTWDDVRDIALDLVVADKPRGQA